MADKWLRETYTDTLIKLAREDERIVLLEADVIRSSGTTAFRDNFPNRTFNVGVAEANMIGIASGLSATGKIPFACSFATFASRRAYDQFFISANYAGLNVKLIGTDPGVAAQYNGGTHMPFEDAGLMRNIPHLVVFEPCDHVSLQALLRQSAFYQGCTYMRLHRREAPQVSDQNENFELGKGKVLKDGSDLVIFFAGVVLFPEVMTAVERLAKEGISAALVDMHTLKPLDVELVVNYARRTGAVITCENHQIINGLGSAVAEVLVEHEPVPMLRVGIRDEFGEVGPLDYLKERYALTGDSIYQQSLKVLKRKKKVV